MSVAAPSGATGVRYRPPSDQARGPAQCGPSHLDLCVPSQKNTHVLEGIWDLSVSTPLGRIQAVVELLREDGVLTGTAHGSGEKVPLADVALDGDRLAWKQAVTKPVRLNLVFAVKVTGRRRAGETDAMGDR